MIVKIKHWYYLFRVFLKYRKLGHRHIKFVCNYPWHAKLEFYQFSYVMFSWLNNQNRAIFIDWYDLYRLDIIDTVLYKMNIR